MSRLMRSALLAATVLATVPLAFGIGGRPGLADVCPRLVGIDPQVTAPEGAGSVTLTVHTGGCLAAGTVGYAVYGGTASPNADYVLGDGVLRWDAGDGTPRVISAAVVPDAERERDLEDFQIALVNPSAGLHLLSPIGQGRIFDDDWGTELTTVDDQWCPGSFLTQPTPSPEPADPEVCGWDNGDIMPLVRVVRNRLTPVPARVWVDTVDGTAVAGVDYVAVHTAVTIDPGRTAVQVPVPLLSRNASTRHFSVHLSQANIVDGSARVVIGGPTV